jgi:hypothetical protein
MKRSLLVFVIVSFTIDQARAHADEQFFPFDSLEIHNQLNVAKDSLPYALVAGGSKGIGYAIALALAKRNYNLILIARGLTRCLPPRTNWRDYTPFMWKFCLTI